jgi:hypothetical protein
MLEVIGAGTSSNAGSITDHHEFYKSSALCDANSHEVDDMLHDNEDGDASEQDHIVEQSRCGPLGSLKRGSSRKSISHARVQKQPLWIQFKLIGKKVFICYWRTPTYNLVRFFINIIIALVFGSAYAHQEYSTPVGVVSRSAVIYITLLFCGVVGMQTVLPVTFAERPAFYREQQSEMYSIAVYTTITTLVEVSPTIMTVRALTKNHSFHLDSLSHPFGSELRTPIFLHCRLR